LWPFIKKLNARKNLDRRGQQLKPTVLVLLATYNGKPWLKEQLDSILQQHEVDIKVAVSDDMSSDGTWDWLQETSEKNERVTLLPQIGKFGGAARNFFRLLRDVDFSYCNYVSFADQDDIWLPEKLSLAHALIQNQSADGYSSNVLAFWPDGRKMLVNKAQPQKTWDYLFEAAGPGCTYVIKSELAIAIQTLLIKRWDEAQEVGLHDWFAYAFARANDYKWVIDERPGMLYRQHETNQVGVNSGRRAFLNRLQTVTSGWAFDQAVLITKLVGLEHDAFVKRWIKGGRIGLLILALHSCQCRRRLRDSVFFFLSCLLLFFRPSKHGIK
jgi:rhamnosyltransferase